MPPATLKDLAELCLKGFSNRSISMVFESVFARSLWCHAYAASRVTDQTYSIYIHLADPKKSIRRIVRQEDVNDGSAIAALMDIDAGDKPVGLEILLNIPKDIKQ